MSTKRVFALLGSALLFIGAGCSVQTDQAVAVPVMPIIDTHVHLWDTEQEGGAAWPPPSETVLFRPVLPEHHQEIAVGHGVRATIVVEAAGDGRIRDNQWMLDITKHAPERYPGVVGNLPIGTDAFAALLARFSADSRYVGIRMRQRPGGEAFFTDAVWRDLGLLSEKGLCLDVLLANFSLADIDTIASRLPDLKICINHLSGLTIDGSPLTEDWKTALTKAAAHPNVVCKVSGIFERSGERPAPTDLVHYKPVIDAVFAAFGKDRVLYGSNWPVSDRGGSYTDQLKIIRDSFSGQSAEVFEHVFWKNAAAFYGVSLPEG